jgi:NTP pyrophosphatase (non-canonical NTP hydrolase)
MSFASYDNYARQTGYRQVAANLRDKFRVSIQDHGDRQFLALAEEVGEAIQQWRRNTNRARRLATGREVLDELADVVITAYVTAELIHYGDLDVAILDKLYAIEERGGV